MNGSGSKAQMVKDVEMLQATVPSVLTQVQGSWARLRAASAYARRLLERRGSDKDGGYAAALCAADPQVHDTGVELDNALKAFELAERRACAKLGMVARMPAEWDPQPALNYVCSNSKLERIFSNFLLFLLLLSSFSKTIF